MFIKNLHNLHVHSDGVILIGVKVVVPEAGPPLYWDSVGIPQLSFCQGLIVMHCLLQC